ncbi:MAG: FHA domain-containing protein [Microbacterium sp.]
MRTKDVSPGHPPQPTTTHAPWGAGDPHLLIVSEDERILFPLELDLVTIGSADGNHVQLDGTASVHATIRHDDRDEYVLTMHGPGETNARSIEGQDDRTEVLRTGARFTMGPWRIVFVRAEYADHGRPYGGREGGEGTHQQPQPDRPVYRRPESPD